MMLNYESLQENEQLSPLEIPPVTKVQLVKYAGASGDFNPLHTDDEFARSIGMDGVIAHGMLIMGFLGKYVMKLAGTDSRVYSFYMRFGAMTYPGDRITCSGIVEKLYKKNGKKYVELELYANKSPKVAVGTGKAILEFF